MLPSSTAVESWTSSTNSKHRPLLTPGERRHRRLPTPFVHRAAREVRTRIGGPSSRPELNVAQKILGARRRASAEVTFDLMTVASRDRIAMSQAPDHTQEPQHSVNATGLLAMPQATGCCVSAPRRTQTYPTPLVGDSHANLSDPDFKGRWRLPVDQASPVRVGNLGLSIPPSTLVRADEVIE
jgi:hypothetical protein